MTIQEQIISDIKEAMKAREQDKLRVLRSLKAKLMEKEISERKDGEAKLTDEQAVEVLMKAAKQRKESIEQFEEGGREDLAENEKEELDIIETYLPEMMDEDEVRKVVKEKIEAIGASGMQDMGKVMGPLMGQLKGKADGSMVSQIVKEELGG
ncbi:GatB/YqeY domain-containing protein [Gracilimonas sp.]|uniref:GatB/YqeY domain-containing protein n=1 Tax=Gracilimonas sp. TaxID=1974203 RepID=UPI0032EFF88E